MKEKPHDDCILMFNELKLDEEIISSRVKKQNDLEKLSIYKFDDCTVVEFMQVCPVDAISRTRN